MLRVSVNQKYNYTYKDSEQKTKKLHSHTSNFLFVAMFSTAKYTYVQAQASPKPGSERSQVISNIVIAHHVNIDIYSINFTINHMTKSSHVYGRVLA